jgi:hypothetical protein
MLIWIYSGELDVPTNIFEILELYYLAYEYQVPDLMWRCEEEINMKVSPKNVVDVLVKYYQKLNYDYIEGEALSNPDLQEENLPNH